MPCPSYLTIMIIIIVITIMLIIIFVIIDHTISPKDKMQTVIPTHHKKCIRIWLANNLSNKANE